jgi:hypothetical protein
MTIDSDAAKVTASRLVRRFIFNAIQGGASEAQILYDRQYITTAYWLDGQQQRQEDMPASIWPQILRYVRNMAFLTLGPRPPLQEGNAKWVLADEQRGEERHYTLGITITHDEASDDIRIVIPAPTRRLTKRSEGFNLISREKI